MMQNKAVPADGTTGPATAAGAAAPATRAASDGTGDGTSVDVSIIIVNWNTQGLLRDCLQSIYRHAGGESFEIIVADNHSADGSAEMVAAEFPNVRLIRNQDNLGFAAANNQGIAIARGRYVLLLNSDTVVLAGTISKSLAFADRHPEAAVVGCRTRFPDGLLQPNCYQFPSLLNLALSLSQLAELFRGNRFFGRRRLTWWDYASERRVDALAGCFMLVRAEAIRQVGPLAEDYFMYSEDTDWCWRFAQAGWQVWYTPEPELIHLRAASASKCETDMRLQERRSLLLFFEKKSGRCVRRIANLMFLAGSLSQLPILATKRLCGGRHAEAASKKWPLTTTTLKFHLLEGMRGSLRDLRSSVPPLSTPQGPATPSAASTSS